MVTGPGGDGARHRQPPPADGGTVTIDVDPSMIPQLAATFAQQAQILRRELENSAHDLRIHQPWLGDPVSAEATRRYNNHFADDALSLVNVLTQLATEYQAHYEALMAAAKHYNVTEETNAALMERGIQP